MKKVFITIISTLIWVSGMKAQTNITVPEFSQSSIMLFADVEFGADCELYFFDGATALPVIKVPGIKGKSALEFFFPQLGHIINELKKRGFKLIDTEIDSGNNYIYYFQKD